MYVFTTKSIQSLSNSPYRRSGIALRVLEVLKGWGPGKRGRAVECRFGD